MYNIFRVVWREGVRLTNLLVSYTKPIPNLNKNKVSIPT